MRSETVVHGYRPQAGIASSFDIDMRVPDNRGFLRTHPMLFEQPARAFGVGLLGGKAVSPIDLAEEGAQPERFHDGARGNDGLVREHGQLAGCSVRRLLNSGKRLTDARVDRSVGEFVFAEVRDKKLKTLANDGPLDRFAPYHPPD